MRFKADRSKISYRHCDSGDLLQMATVESRGRKGAEVKRQERSNRERTLASSLHRHSINTKTFLKC